MPIPVPYPPHTPDSGGRGLPEKYLRDLTALRRRETIDPVDGSETDQWDAIVFTGRIARGQSSEDDDLGRQAGIVAVKLLTNYSGLRAEDRIIDPDQTPDPVPWAAPPTWQLDGDPWPVYDAGTIHHYEARLRRVTG